jgi:hypothetical protein
MARRRRTPQVRRIGDRIEIAVTEVQRFLATDTGRTLRRGLAAGMVLTAPLLFKVPGLRRYPLLRLLETVGGAALIVKLAEALRDWDPGDPRPVVLDVPAHRPD